MDPEVQKIIEELRKVSSSQELADYEKQLRKSSTALGKNTSLNAIEIKQIEKEIAQRKKLFEATTNLEGHFKHFGQTMGMSEKNAMRFARGTQSTTGFIGKFASAVEAGTGQIQDYTKSLAEFGAVGQALARGGEFLGATLDQFRTLSSVGANFNKSLVDLRESASSAGLPINDFVDLVAKNSEALAAMFGTTTEGAKSFAVMSRDFRRANMDFLAPLGLTVEEVNEFLLGNLNLSRRLGHLDQMSTEQQFQSSRNYVEQLDRLSRLTGQQRDALMAEMEAQLANERFAAMLSQQTPETAKRLQAFSSTIGKAAPDLAVGLQDLIATAGNPVTDAAIQFAQNIPEAQGIVKELIAGNITTEEALIRLRDAGERSFNRFADVTATGTVEFLRLQKGVNDLRTMTLDTAAAQTEQSITAGKLTQNLSEFETVAKDLTSAVDQTKTGFLKLIDDFVGEGTGSLNSVLRNLTEKIKGLTPEMQGLLFVMKEGLQTGFNIMKDTVPMYLAVRKGVRDGMMGGGMMGGAGGKKGNMMKNVAKGGGAFLGFEAASMGANMAGQEDASTLQKVGGIATGAAGGALTGAMVGSMIPVIGTAIGAAIGGVVGGANAAYQGYSEEIKGFFSNMFGGGRAIGTAGTTGNFIESRDTLAQIHAGERVLSPAEAKNYTDTQMAMANNNMASAGAGVTNQEFVNMVKELKEANKNLNMLVGISDATRQNTDRAKNLLANRTESLV